MVRCGAHPNPNPCRANERAGGDYLWIRALEDGVTWSLPGTRRSKQKKLCGTFPFYENNFVSSARFGAGEEGLTLTVVPTIVQKALQLRVADDDASTFARMSGAGCGVMGITLRLLEINGWIIGRVRSTSGIKKRARKNRSHTSCRNY